MTNAFSCGRELAVLQLKNIMRAQVRPDSAADSRNELTATDQQSHIKFDAFFGNGHVSRKWRTALGIKKTIDGKGNGPRGPERPGQRPSRRGKADILGLLHGDAPAWRAVS